MNGLWQIVLQFRRNGGIFYNRCQPFAFHCRFLSGNQFLNCHFADVQLMNVVIDVFHSATTANQRRGSFGANSGNPRDIIGGITHECLQINHRDGIKAVFLPKPLYGVINIFPIGDESNGHMVGDKL